MADNLMDLTELQRVLEEYAKDAVELYKYQIALGHHNASRELTGNVKSEVVVGDQCYEVTLTLKEYWKYIEGGSKGRIDSPSGAEFPAHFPPLSALEKWVNVKPILPKRENGHIPSPKELAFLIGRKIRDHGIEPFPALATTKEELDKIYREKMSAALGHDIEFYIRKAMAN